MRLILCYRGQNPGRSHKTPDGTFVFQCMEEFSVGPLQDWHDPEQFNIARETYWHKTSMFDLPDGSKMDPFVWMQTLPECDLVALVQSGVSINDIPEPHDFDDLIPIADTIEIWTEPSVQGQLFLWHLIALMNRMGIAPAKVLLCEFPKDWAQRQAPQFWPKMLSDAPRRSVPARAITSSTWEQTCAYWNAIINLPQRFDPELLGGADDQTLNIFRILGGRHPNAETGLTNLQTRLLKSTKTDRAKMAYVIANAMAAGMDENDLVGDYTLQAELEEMSRANDPLVAIEGTGSMHHCEVRLTSHGADKLRQIGP